MLQNLLLLSVFLVAKLLYKSKCQSSRKWIFFTNEHSVYNLFDFLVSQSLFKRRVFYFSSYSFLNFSMFSPTFLTASLLILMVLVLVLLNILMKKCFATYEYWHHFLLYFILMTYFRVLLIVLNKNDDNIWMSPKIINKREKIYILSYICNVNPYWRFQIFDNQKLVDQFSKLFRALVPFQNYYNK